MTRDPIAFTYDFDGIEMSLTFQFDPPDDSVGIVGGWFLAEAIHVDPSRLRHRFNRDTLASLLGWPHVYRAEEFAAELAEDRTDAARDLSLQDTQEDM